MFEFILGLFSVFSTTDDADMHSVARKSNKQNIIVNIRNKKNYLKKDKIPWSGHFAANNFRTKTSKQELKKIKNTLRETISALPKKHTKILDHLEVKNKEHVSRGMANSHKMILNIGTIETQEELAAIFLHEMGHVVDLGYFKGSKESGESEFYDGKKPIYKDDRSLAFYRLSWKNASTRKKGSLRSDFVSGYALSDPFEDFAEHYIFYRLHGEKFRVLAKKSKILQKKYNFLRYNVFDMEEYQTKKVATSEFNSDIWDTTLVKYVIEKNLISRN